MVKDTKTYGYARAESTEHEMSCVELPTTPGSARVRGEGSQQSLQNIADC